MIQVYAPNNTNFANNGVALMPYSCLLSMEINGSWTVQIENGLDDRFQNIVENSILKVPTPYREQLFRITQIEKSDTGVSAIALPVFLDAKNEVFIYDQRPTDKNGQQVLDILTNGTKYKGHSNITKVNTAYYQMNNLIECISSDDDNSFLKRWGGEIRYSDYEIYINDRLGSDNGARVEFGFNLNSIQESIDMSNVVTKIIPVAYNGYTLPQGETVTSPNLNKYPTSFIRVINYENIKLSSDAQEDDEENGVIVCDTIEELQNALRDASKKEFENGIDIPSITYQVDMVDLAKTQEYSMFKDLVAVNLGDTVHVKHRRLGIETEARIIALEYDCISQKITNLTIGDYVENYFDKTSDITSSAEKVIDTGNNTLMADKIAGVINLLNTSLRAQKDIAQKQDVRAILFEDLDTNSPTFGALCIGTQGIQISKQRNETNTDWVWGTAINFESIIADYIITGILSDRLGNNFWNLDTGELSTKYMKAVNADISGKLTSNEGIIGGFNLSQNGFTKLSEYSLKKIYTESDADRIQKIIQGTISPTQQDYELYDLDKSGKITAADYVMVKNLLIPAKGNKLYTEIKINPSPFNFGDVSPECITVRYLATDKSVIKESVIRPGILEGNIESQSVYTDIFNAKGIATFEKDLWTDGKTVYNCQGNGTGWQGGQVYAEYFSDTPNFYILATGGGYLAFGTQNSRVYLDGKPIGNWTHGTFHPRDAGTALGNNTSSGRWYRLYAANASDDSSDRRLKTDFTKFDDRYIKLFEMLEPTLYHWISEKRDGKNGDMNAGLIAQDVEKAMNECGISRDEFSVYNISENGEYSLVYRYIDMLMMFYIQNKIKSFDQRVSKIEEVIK